MSLVPAAQMMAEVERILSEEGEVSPAPGGAGQFHVHDEPTANWVVRKVVEARQYAERVKEWAEQECRRAQRDEERLMFMFGRELELWTKDRLSATNGRRKSLNLPAGSVGFRHINMGLVVIDDAAVIEWARSNQPKAIQTKEYLSKTAINEHFAASGEVPPGVQVEPEREKFYVR